MSYWHDKVALITGGSRGLGLVLAETLAGRGASVVVVARGKEALDQAVSQIGNRGHVAQAVTADVTKDDDVERLVGEAEERFGRIDVLANCAGRSTRAGILETSPADFQSLWELNFLATVRCTRAAAPYLLQTHGHLINVGSLASKTAARYLGAYPASKFPLAAYSQQLRLELGPAGLHVLLVCPGPIARPDGGQRYIEKNQDLPESASWPGGGAQLRAIDPVRLAQRILIACEKRQPELVVPRRARLLFALSQLHPKWGDWLLKRMT